MLHVIRWIGWGALLTVLGCSGLTVAEKKMDDGRYAEAVPILEAYAKENPEAIEARGRLGFAYLKTGRIDDAIRQFETVLDRQPGDPHAVLYLGIAYLNKDRISDAISVWEGYRNRRQPMVEDEIRRQLTLLRVVESQRYAEQALAQEERLGAGQPAEDSVAVLYYRDLTPGKQMGAFQKGLAAMIITDLSKIKSLKVVERIRMNALLEEMKFAETGVVAAQTAPRISRLLGAGNFVVGNLSEGSIRAVTTVNGQSSAVTVSQDDFWQVPIFAVRTVVESLGISLTAQEEAAMAVPHTKVYNAFIFYGEALNAQDAGRWEEAKNFYDMAVEADPGFGLAKDGGAGCPSGSAPSLSALSAMSAAAVASSASSAVSAASDAAGGDADAAADASAGGDAGGAGGGDGGDGGGGDGGGGGVE